MYLQMLLQPQKEIKEYLGETVDMIRQKDNEIFWRIHESYHYSHRPDTF
jgi:hypothetical protein